MCHFKRLPLDYHPAAFWAGYRAFVLGGRRVKTKYRGAYRLTVMDPSTEPFDDMSAADKAQWRLGVEFAQREREECLKLMKKQKL